MKKLITGGLLAAMLAALFTVSAFAANTAGALTVSDAVGQVVANSEELKKNSESQNLNDIQRKDLQSQLNATDDEATQLNLEISLLQNELQSSVYSDTAETFREKATYSVEQIFASIIAAENDLALTRQNLKISQREYTIAKVQLQLGKISQLELKNTKAAYEKMENSIAAKESAIDKAYISLNELMGASLANRYSLKFSVSYAPMESADVNTAIGLASSESTSVKNLASSMKVADLKYDTYYNDPDTSEAEQETLKNDKNQAHRNYASGVTDMESKVLTTYRSIIDMEADMATAQLTLTGLREQLALKEAEFAAGKSTELEVDKLKLQVAQQQESIRKLTCDHYLKVKSYKNANL